MEHNTYSYLENDGQIDIGRKYKRQLTITGEGDCPINHLGNVFVAVVTMYISHTAAIGKQQQTSWLDFI